MKTYRLTKNSPVLFATFSLFSLSLTLPVLPVLAEDQEHYLSVVPRGVVKVPVKAPVSVPAKKVAAPSAKQPAAQAASPGAKATGDADSSSGDTAQAGETPGAGEQPPAAKSFYSSTLEQAVSQYRSAPSAQTYSQVLNALKSCLAAGGGLRLSPAILAKDNPYLNDFKPRVLEASGVRVWTFPKATERNRALLQWFDVHQTVIGVGRRKKVVSSSSVRFQEMVFSRDLNIKDAGMLALKDSGRRLVIAGDADDGSLAMQAFRMTESGWQHEPDFNAQIPSFLASNVSGRVSLRGSDLIFNVGKMIAVTDAAGNKRFLPEAESATYKFLVRSTESGYQVSTSIPNEDPFSAVHAFMQAVAQGRTDVERALLADPKVSASLVSLPKYLGLQGRAVDPICKVVEMSVPAARGNRFRLINIGKDDLIFDVGRIKNQWLIKAIYIAAPDPFLAETSRYFPLFSRFEHPPETPKEGEAGVGPAAGVVPPSLRKK